MLDGRTDERRWLDARLGGLNEGACFAAVVRGEAGVGKSALIAAAVDGLAGVRVLRTRGYEADADIPFAGLLELVAPLLERRDELPIAQREALATAFALAPPSAHDRFAVPAGLLGLIGLAATDGPVLVVVDDAQWLDDASRDAIRFVARRLAASGAGILLAVRDGAGPALDLSGLDELVLGGLDDESAARLVRRRWPRLPATTVSALVAATAGNPLALLEVPGVLTAAQHDGDEPLTDPLPTTTAVERAFVQQLEALPAGVRRALVLAAAASRSGVDALAAALRELGLPMMRSRTLSGPESSASSTGAWRSAIRSCAPWPIALPPTPSGAPPTPPTPARAPTCDAAPGISPRRRPAPMTRSRPSWSRPRSTPARAAVTPRRPAPSPARPSCHPSRRHADGGSSRPPRMPR